ncbi:MAG TPA: chemotaxis protein CheD [Gemmatimonadaceae bacterium]|nr:chemotaxis protein CheD [Gemmatimonadaceae bacterium]
MKERLVRVADAAVGQGELVLSTVGLGSCVAIMLHDADARIGGLAHILLPSQSLSNDRENRAKFPGTAVPLLLERMTALGARPARITARIAGGASMFAALLPATGVPMGERNVLATRDALREAKIPVVAQDVGGEHGRSIYFHVQTGTIEVKSLVKGDVVL